MKKKTMYILLLVICALTMADEGDDDGADGLLEWEEGEGAHDDEAGGDEDGGEEGGHLGVLAVAEEAPEGRGDAWNITKRCML